MFPPQHLIVLRREAWQQNKWIARALTDAFARCTETFAKAQRSFPYVSPWLDAELEETEALMGADFHADGFERNRATIEVFAEQAHLAGIVGRRISAEEYFASFSSAMGFAAQHPTIDAATQRRMVAHDPRRCRLRHRAPRQISSTRIRAGSARTQPLVGMRLRISPHADRQRRQPRRDALGRLAVHALPFAARLRRNRNRRVAALAVSQPRGRRDRPIVVAIQRDAIDLPRPLARHQPGGDIARHRGRIARERIAVAAAAAAPQADHLVQLRPVHRALADVALRRVRHQAVIAVHRAGAAAGRRPRN